MMMAIEGDWDTQCETLMRRVQMRMEQLDGPRAAADDAELRELTGYVYNKGENKAYFGGVISPQSVAFTKQLLDDMAAFDEIEIDLNTPGGHAFSGVAIRNLFATAKQKITMNVVGMAYSAGSMALQGADVRNVARGGMIGVHKAWMPVTGNAAKLEQVAAKLRNADQAMLDAYAERVPQENLPKLEQLMDADTALSGVDAVKIGLADNVIARKAEKFAKPAGAKEVNEVRDKARAEFDEEVKALQDADAPATQEQPAEAAPAPAKKPLQAYINPALINSGL